MNRLATDVRSKNPVDAASVVQRRVGESSIRSPFAVRTNHLDLDGRDFESASAAVEALVGVPGVTLLTGPMGVGKSHVVGELVVRLVGEEQPFVLLDAQDLDPGDRALAHVAGHAVSKVYGADPDVAIEVVASGRVVVIVDGIEEVPNASELAHVIGAARGSDRLRVLVAVRSSSTDVLSALGDVDSIVRLEEFEVVEAERQLAPVVAIVGPLTEALHASAELRTPLAIALMQELDGEPERIRAVLSDASLQQLWRQLIDRRLGADEDRRRRLAEHLGWAARVMSEIEKRPVLREERAVPEWLEGRAARRARGALCVSAAPVLVVAMTAHMKWRGFSWGAVGSWLVASSVVALVYWWNAMKAIDRARERTPPDVFDERRPSWAAFRRRTSLREYASRIRRDVLGALPAGVVVVGLGGPLIHRDLGSRVVSVLVFLAVFAVAVILLFLVGKQSGPTWGTLGVAAVIGLGPSSDDLPWSALVQGLTIGLISGLASGVVFGFFDLGDRRVLPPAGAVAPRRMVWRSWRVVASYEATRWMAFGFVFALLAVLLRPVSGIDKNWLWWGVGGGAAGSLIFGLSAGSYPFFNREISSWFLRRHHFGGDSLTAVLSELADAGLMVRVRQGYAYRLHHVSMLDAALELRGKSASGQ